MDATTFLTALSRRSTESKWPSDPLASATWFLAQHSETAEGRALRRVLQALTSGNGDFTESDVWLFSTETLSLVSALIDARLSGRYQEEAWQRACH